MQTYDAFLKTARQYASDAEGSRLRLMLFLVKTETNRDLWLANTHGIRSWPDLLQREGLCTAKHYRDFKHAQKQFKPRTVKRLGTYAAISLARIADQKQRKAITAKTFRWIGKHQVSPTYQRISEYVRAETRGAKPKPHNFRAEVKTLRTVCDQQKQTIAGLQEIVQRQSRYIRRLKVELKKHGIAIPPQLQS